MYVCAKCVHALSQPNPWEVGKCGWPTDHKVNIPRSPAPAGQFCLHRIKRNEELSRGYVLLGRDFMWGFIEPSHMSNSARFILFFFFLIFFPSLLLSFILFVLSPSFYMWQKGNRRSDLFAMYHNLAEDTWLSTHKILICHVGEYNQVQKRGHVGYKAYQSSKTDEIEDILHENRNEFFQAYLKR